MAVELGKNPEEVRRRNFIPPSAFPYATPTGQNYDSGEYDRALTKALGLAGIDQLRREQKERLQRNDRTLLGIGQAVYVEMCGFGPYESAVVRVEPSGTVTAYTGTSAHGQGHETTFAQIIADHLGVDFDKIVVRHGDTAAVQMGNGTGGSRSLAVGGTAILNATLKVQREGATDRGQHAGGRRSRTSCWSPGAIRSRARRPRRWGSREIAAMAHGETLAQGLEHGLEATDFFRPVQLVYPFGAHVAVVEVDRDSGAVRLRDYVSVDDCGVRISPDPGGRPGSRRASPRASPRRCGRSSSTRTTASSPPAR